MSGTRIRSVEAVRSGGFAAIRRRRRTEGDALSPDQAAMMWTLLRKPPAPAAGADRFTYRLTVVTEDGAEHAFDLPEDAVPEVLRPLLP